MRQADVERWAVRVVDAVDRGEGVEDDAVEIKRAPKPNLLDNARRIAGHANSLRGDPMLWIFGLDEDGARHPLPPALADPAAWWAPIEARFDDVAPSPSFARFGGLLAIGFDTSRAPFVVRLSEETASREVPWREATAVRSATRFDLLRLLVPVALRPRITVLGGEITVWAATRTENVDPALKCRWTSRLECYFDVAEGAVIPDHRCSATAVFNPKRKVDMAVACYSHAQPRIGRTGLEPDPNLSLADRGHDQLIIHGSTRVDIVAQGRSKSVRADMDGQFEVLLGLAGLDPVDERIEATMTPRPLRDGGIASWELRGRPT